MNKGITVVLTIIGVAVGTLVGATLLGGTAVSGKQLGDDTSGAKHTSKTGSNSTSKSASQDADALNNANEAEKKAAAKLRRVEKVRDDALAQVAVLKQERDDLKAEIEAMEAEFEAIGFVPLKDLELALKFGNDDAIRALGELNWDEMGGAAHEMREGIKKFLADVRRNIENEEPVDMSGMSEMMAPGTKLMPLMTSLNGKVKSYNSSMGSYSHPLTLFNLMAAELEAAKLALTDAQHSTLKTLGENYLKSFDENEKSYTNETLHLQKLADEVELKLTTIEAAFDLLTEKQAAAIRDEDTKGTMGFDSYNPAMVFMDSMGPIIAKSSEELLQPMKVAIANKFKVEASRLDAGDYILEDWIADLKGQGILELDVRSPWDSFMPQTHTLLACAQAQLKYTPALLGVIRPSEEELTIIRAVGSFLYPRIADNPADPTGTTGG